MNTEYIRKRRRFGKASSVGETMTAVLKKLGRRQSGIHPEIWSRWNEIVGPDLAKRTLPEGLRGKTLILAVKSSAWLQELSFLKLRLLERLAEEVGPGVISDIRMVLDPELPIRQSLVPPPPPQTENYAHVLLSPEISAALEAVSDENLREVIGRAARSNLKSHQTIG